MKTQLHEIAWLDCKIESNVVEGKTGKKKTQYILSGPFMRADVPNRNNRVYKREEANRAIAKLRPMVEAKRVRMLVDHPDFFSSGSSLIKSGAILLEISDVGDDGYAYYKAKILNTAVGKDLKAILDEGGKIGVSTRGRGIVKEEEVPGYEGKFDTIYEWDLESIDFVDDPSVIDTETYMHMESNKRSNEMYKNVEELKTAQPDMFKKIVESATTEMKTSFDVQIKELEAKIQEAAQGDSVKSAELDTLIESIKKVFPDKFVVVAESAIVAEKDKQITVLDTKLKEADVALVTLQSEVKKINDAHIQAERDSCVENLKVTDAEYFNVDSFKDCFENCITKDEVKTVYEANSKILKEMKEKFVSPAPSKTKQVEGNADDKSDLLNEAQKKDFRAKNLQRRRNSLDAWTEVVYFEKYCKAQ